MLNKVRITHVFVADQDEALDFYVGKLGLEVADDIDLGVMRWLTVRVPGDDPDRVILLEKPGPPAMDAQAAEQVRELIAKGASGFTLGFTTDDARKTYDELKANGVEMTDGPTEQPYGIDFGARDPFGNHFRVSQPAGPIG
ncbi:VOC family protein [Actinoplanes sp. N902-109]|uniref:VOC family protein n=1 Tax=Actinoplanes sp. (strain N902-109) TaxID=649831 RepID=UPI0003294092|nr:VOC family protein [Actinoplanes sp. N902-109]AGL19864.1 Glyoxalase/bleomycin resistance protein/dioxygenase [Actinoplanes sp. N902-109]